MSARLHRHLARLTWLHTLRRIDARHWFAGCGYPANDDPLFDLPTRCPRSAPGRGPMTAQRSVGPNFPLVSHH